MRSIKGDNIPLAVAAILMTSLALSLGDAIIKQISTGFPLWQIFALRSVLAIPVLGAVAIVRGGGLRSLVPIAPGWTAIRSFMLAGMWVAYYAALPHVALSVAAAVYYTLPLFITLFAALLLRERVSVVAWVAVAIGFGGVLLILRPRGEDFNLHALLPLVSAVLYALAMILTRSKCREEQPLALSMALHVTIFCVGIAGSLLTLSVPAADAEANPFLFGNWVAMGAREWMVMGVLAAAAIIGSIGTAIAYQAGPSSVVSTFDFSYLAFATLWGFLFFSETGDAMMIAGMVLIAAAGILTVRARAA